MIIDQRAIDAIVDSPIGVNLDPLVVLATLLIFAGIWGREWLEK